ncbi:MAG TPA: lipoyl(octanoyl) transferase LipB [Candidatus Hydrogenedentes bacterium]|nr:lipoyl(octanoyl) transferase LipB [Candidatus Hydrogenedentota bacterium]
MTRWIETIRFEQPVPYAAMMALQQKRREAVERGAASNTLFLLEHTPVITLGRKSDPANVLLSREELAKRGIELVETDRGGDVTYHGPGQLVAYPVLALTAWKQSYRWYLRSLESVLIALLRGYGLQAERAEGFTGVWVNGAKMAAIGVGVHNWVTSHGIALNVAPDMSHFRLIVPCGIQDKPVCSLAEAMQRPPGMKQVMDDFEKAFRDYFETPDETPVPEP